MGIPINSKECFHRYGPIVNGQWPQAVSWCTLVKLPKQIEEKVINSATGKMWSHVYCNIDMKAPLLEALTLIVMNGHLAELETFDGCFNVRNIRGSDTQLSAHAFALALDLNAAKNPLGGPSLWTQGFIDCFKQSGFYWGGDFVTRKDPMHFSLTGF